MSHLVHIVPSLEERHGGPSKSARALANHLASAGDEVRLLATEDAPGSFVHHEDDQAHLEAFPRLAPRWLCRSPGLRQQLLRSAGDCFHHHSLWLLTLRYATEAARRHGRPLVISPRGMMSPWAWQHRRLRKQLASWLVHPGAFRQAAGWHATSTEEADDIRALDFRQPICVAPNGVALPSETELATARAAWLEILPSARQRPVALFYSRLHRKKRVRELIDLWLSTTRGDWLLLVAGMAEEYNAAELTTEFAARGVTERVHILDSTGHPPPYAIASLFLLPSHSENFGLVIAEALAAGVPTVVTDTTPWSGLNANSAGWCVPWEDYPGTLQQALALDVTRLQTMGAAGHAWMERDYSWSRAAGLLREFYASLLNGRR